MTPEPYRCELCDKAQTALRNLRAAEDRQLRAMTTEDWIADQNAIDRHYASIVEAAGEAAAVRMMREQR